MLIRTVCNFACD